MQISDAGLDYKTASGPLHVLLKQVLTQVAACALTHMMNSRAEWGAEASLERAWEAAAQARDGILSLSVPREAERHFHHTIGAARAIEAAVGELRALKRRDDADTRNRLTTALRAAAGHLRAASMLAHGDPIVDLSQACCAFHGGQAIHNNL